MDSRYHGEETTDATTPVAFIVGLIVSALIFWVFYSTPPTESTKTCEAIEFLQTNGYEVIKDKQ